MTSQLQDLLALEQLDTCRFQSIEHRENFRKTLFGGQVLGQALMAASQTIGNRPAHSLHAYFLRAGRSNEPVVYEVENVRDGRSISNRRVVALQSDKPIFHLSCSFHEPEDGYEHQCDFPSGIPEPETLLAEIQNEGFDPHTDKKHPDSDEAKSSDTANPFIILPTDKNLLFGTEKYEPEGYYWIKAIENFADTKALHLAALAFSSDLGILASTLLPHPTNLFDESIFAASIDHAMWFHSSDFRIDEWLLYKVASPWAGSARGFGTGSIFNRSGRLIASTTQEGMIRPLGKFK